MSDWHYLPHGPRRRRRGRRTLAAAALLVCIAAAATAVALGARGASSSRHSRAASARTVAHAATHPSPPKPDPTVLAVDRVLAQTPVVRVGGPWHRYVALTFDDGPSPYTERLLRVLREVHAPATFFQVGRMIPVFAGAARAVNAAGFPVGDHTQDHPPLAALGLSAQRDEILTPIARMRAAGEPRPDLFRPPYMSYDSATVALMRRLRMLMVLWTVDSEDYRLPGVPAIVYRVLSGAQPGAIVLMHDGGGPRFETVEAVPQIVTALRRRHYQLVTVPELLLKDPPIVSQQRPSARYSGAG